MCLETILHLFKLKYISSDEGFEELQYVDLQLDLQLARVQGITVCRFTKN